MLDFWKILPKGEGNAMPARDLVKLLGLDSERELRRCIADARKEGQIICACSAGYFVPVNKSEILKWMNTMTRKAASTFAALKSARVALRQIDGQIQFHDLV